MSDKEWLLTVLQDRLPHSNGEIVQRSTIERGVRLTVHSRVADLRRDGWVIDCTPIPHLKEAIYQLVGDQQKENVRVRKEKNTERPPVQGYVFVTQDPDDPHDRTICKIVGRANVSTNEAAEYGAAFLVEFGDGSRDVVYGEELRPWYPT